MDRPEQLHEFLRQSYYGELMRLASEDKPALVADFQLLDRFNPVIADELLEKPQEVLKDFDKAVEAFGLGAKIPVRLRNLPDRRFIRVRNFRAEHIGKLISTDVIVKSATEVKPQISKAYWRCTECEHDICVVQEEAFLMQKATRCDACGRRGDFGEPSRTEMIDTRMLKGVEPFEITEGEQPSEIAIWMREDLTTPRMQKKTDPGARIRIVGWLKELPKRVKGKLSTKLDTYIEANYVEPSEIEFEDIEITPEDEAQILQLSRDPNVYQKLRNSIAPGIYGFEEVKEAIVLQLFGGMPHRLPDSTHIRGNIHILLTGDPSVGKSLVGSSKILHNSDKGPEFTDIGSLVNAALKEGSIERVGDCDVCYENKARVKVLTLNPNTAEIEWKPVSAFIRHHSPKTLLKVMTKSGREVTATKDHSFITLDENGKITPLKGEDLREGTYLPVPLGGHKQLLAEIETGNQVKRTNAKMLPPKIKLDWDFGFFIGIFLAEGSTPGGRVAVSSKNAERRNPVRRVATRLGLKSYEDSTEIAIPSKRLQEFLKVHCYKGEPVGKLKGSGAIRKCLPNFSFFSPMEFVEGLVSGLLSGDGYLTNAHRDGSAGGDLKIELTTISPHLAYGLLEILSLMGIFGIVRKKNYSYKNEKRTKYEITALGQHAQRLLSRIKIVGKPVPKVTRFSEMDTFDCIPCGKLLYDIVRMLGYSKKRHPDAQKRRTFAAMMRTVKGRNKIGRRRLERVLTMLTHEAGAQRNEEALSAISKLRGVVKSDLIWDHVVSVEEIASSEKYVYDLSINGNETFVSNNLVLHNSVILKLASSVVPRGKYVSGSGVTGPGLTASVRKDELFGTWVLEAGALILSNRGLISIDEFDKMNVNDQIAMHEAMSIETVSVAKASIVATLPAQTAVLAGANPKLGRFDPFKSIIEQIEIPETLMSRFDLKFVMRDLPNREKDEQLASHVLAGRLTPETIAPEISLSLLRKFIAYAKKTAKPELSPEAAKVMKDFYVEMRNTGGEAVSITLRQYEALLRLAESSAKIRLDTAVRMEDAERAIRLMKASLMQLGYDAESGRIDIDKYEGGISTTLRSKIRIVMDVIEKLQNELGKEVPIQDVEAAAEQDGVADAATVIDKLKREGMVFEPRPGYIKKT
jgi:replicative DNA helicase Mcm